MADLVTQADLDARFPPRHVAALFCDDGSGVAGPRLAMALDEASRQAEAILRKGWPSVEAIQKLVAADSAVKGAVCRLVMAIGAEGKPEWSGENAPYATFRKDARQTLEDLARAALRSPGEAQAGANANMRARVSNATCPPFVFAPTPGKPNTGGGF